MSNDYDRTLGVVEAITTVVQQCPHGSVGASAEHALGVIKEKGADAMAEQAFLVLTAIQGWRGDRARQVHRSLQIFLDDYAKETPK